MILTKEKLKHFQEKLEKEKTRLEKELAQVGKKNPEVREDWEATPAILDTETSDTGELSNAFEEMENRAAVENSLEEQLVLVNRGLNKIKKGTYGVCEEKGKKHNIEIKRLEANPSASECVKHAK